MVAQEQFSFRLSKDIKELFDNLYDNLGGHKFRIIESAIEAFAALPKEQQRALVSQDDNDRKIILEYLRGLNQKSAKGKRA